MTAFVPTALLGDPGSGAPLTVGLLNNAAGRALHSVEAQFVSLLRAATIGSGLRIRFYTCAKPGGADWPVAAAGEPYAAVGELLASGQHARPVDAMVVTGMAPQAADLREEPIWNELADVVDWAEERAVPVLWSCLAAHAAVLRLAGIARQRLDRKLSGVFECRRVPAGGRLARTLPQSWLTPHSRYHGLPEPALLANGYEIVSRSEETGPDTFVRRSTALSMFCQGHPEYRSDTLLLEYRRDVRRFFKGASREYPDVPRSCLDRALEDRLADLRARAVRIGPDPALLCDITALVDRAAAELRGAAWHGPAVRLCASWLARAVSADALPFAPAVAASWHARPYPQAGLPDAR